MLYAVMNSSSKQPFVLLEKKALTARSLQMVTLKPYIHGPKFSFSWHSQKPVVYRGVTGFQREIFTLKVFIILSEKHSLLKRQENAYIL